VSVEGMNKAEVERGGERSGRLRSILHMIVQGMQKQKPPSPHCKGQASVSCNRKKGKRRGGEAKKTTVRLWKEGERRTGKQPPLNLRASASSLSAVRFSFVSPT
jgi:hypothetical protein